ncbi:unnamed protein product [Citrullus colocynthis]|uniref:Uncharacterized protein n=1 Tax=Citrullus colocynthis TaxID=252529 RepID=A0ABP0XMU4_9ROSI
MPSNIGRSYWEARAKLSPSSSSSCFLRRRGSFQDRFSNPHRFPRRSRGRRWLLDWFALCRKIRCYLTFVGVPVHRPFTVQVGSTPRCDSFGRTSSALPISSSPLWPDVGVSSLLDFFSSPFFLPDFTLSHRSAALHAGPSRVLPSLSPEVSATILH